MELKAFEFLFTERNTYSCIPILCADGFREYMHIWICNRYACIEDCNHFELFHASDVINYFVYINIERPYSTIPSSRYT